MFLNLTSSWQNNNLKLASYLQTQEDIRRDADPIHLGIFDKKNQLNIWEMSVIE